MTSSATAVWLQERTELGILPMSVLDAIAEETCEISIAANRRLVLENTPPEALYILKTGRLERYRTSKTASANAVSLLPGAVVHLQEILLDRPAQNTVITLTDCTLWRLERDRFSELAKQHPEISRIFSQQLAQQLDRVEETLAYERDRQAQLRPYLVPKARRGVIGNSRYAVRLRQQIKTASRDRDPVFVFGEPGLEKDNISALIHFGSPWRREAIVQLPSGLMQKSGAELFGREGGKPGILELVGEGTIILNNIQDLPEQLHPQLFQLLKTGTYFPIGSEEKRLCNAKIILISEQPLSEFQKLSKHRLKAPPLRVRKADIEAYVNYFISLYCRAKGLPKPKVTPEALRRLQGYDFPRNIVELNELVDRAIVQANQAEELTEEIFWSVESKKRRFRYNLLKTGSWRQFLRSPWWPDRLNYWFTTWFFALVVTILFIGPQNRQENFALNLFWAWWWPLILIGFPFVGRVWCAICPFMIYGEITQKLSLWLFPRQLKKWPRQQADLWGGWFLFALFAAIFLWEELWDLPNTAYLSSWLLLLITAGAIVCSLIFERRFWCRYLCPIGGMNGLYAKLSMTELRAQQGICSAECTTYQCYKGGPQKGEGMETNGCPLYSHPAQLQDNRDCVLCMTCLKACPHRSVELNIRPPAIELWTSHTPRADEVALLLLLLGGIFLHRLPEIDDRLSLGFDLTQFIPHLELSLLVLLVPSAFVIGIYGLMRLLPLQQKHPSFVAQTYSYLPLVLGGTLAHYLDLFLSEAGRIVPVTLATFGYSSANLPVWVAHPAVTEFLQGTTLIAATFLSIVLARKISRKSFWQLLPLHLGTIAIAASLWYLIVS